MVVGPRTYVPLGDAAWKMPPPFHRAVADGSGLFS
jgi:hypothetical protein